MKVQVRRWVAVGLMSGSLAISALVGTAAVGASALSEQRDNFVILAGQSAAPAEATQHVTISSVALPASAIPQVFNRDDRT